MHISRRVALAGAGVAAALVVGGSALAATSGSSSTIMAGCFTSTGRLAWLEMSQPGHKCADNLILKVWNVAGQPGPAGPQGKSGLANVQAEEPYGQDVDPNTGITQSSDALPVGQTTVIWAACPSGEVALGGGFRADAAADSNESDSTPTTDTASGLQVLASEPSYETGGKLNLGSAPIVNTTTDNYQPNAWAVTVNNTGTSTMHARVAVVCATASS